MSNSVVKTAKTVEEAIEQALKELDISYEDAEIEVLEEGSKAVLGLFGGKEAKVMVTAKIADSKKVFSLINSVSKLIGIEPKIEVDEAEDSIDVRITGDDVAPLIGRHGETLYALQYIGNLMVNRDKENYKRVSIDIENYRKKREASLVNLANKTAEKVIKYKRPITIDPIPAYERRIIHATLQDHELVETISQGEEPYRKVVVRLKR
ncbi:MAG: protein jag [Clostridiales bacterium]|jgi:spoIIIJ-associated protein|nr:protein jag [Clostridiales bacterium]